VEAIYRQYRDSRIRKLGRTDARDKENTYEKSIRMHYTRKCYLLNSR